MIFDMTRHSLWVAVLCSLSLLLAGCINNDIPYPRIPQNILSIAADGEEAAASIDEDNCQVVLTLAETTDPAQVRFSDFTYTEGAECSLNLLEGEYDLTKPLKVTLSKYQDYEWVITARQTIARSIAIEGQIGSSVIDDVGRRIIVRVPDTYNLARLNMTDIKLGPEGVTTLVPDLTPGEMDFSHPVKVDVSYFGKTEQWTIYVERSHLLVNTTAVDAWSQVIWAYGTAPENSVNGFQYRQADSSDWIDVPKEWITYSGGSFVARIIHLKPETSYVVRAVSDENIGNEVTVTTEPTAVLPSASFDDWWLDGKVWCPWANGGVQYWDTGNTGASTLGESNVTPSDYTATGSGKSAKLETKFVGVGVVGKLAAGSIYTGKFVKVDGTNGILDFGREWTARPTRFKGYYQYHSSPINYASEKYQYLKNRPDSCHIYVILTDWVRPFEIRTNPKNQHLLDFSSSDIIAYGGITTAESSDSYIAFDIPLQYRSTSRKPRYILVCAAASKYGDYFTGGSGSVLYVDHFSFDYDY